MRIYCAGDSFLHAWDERYHALVAKNMIQHPLDPVLYKYTPLPYDYTNWTANHIWLHKQPFPLWLMSLSLRLFGISEWAVRIPSILLSTLGIWLMYASTLILFKQRNAARLAAFFYSINGFIIELVGGRTATDHPDVINLVCIQLAIYFGLLLTTTSKRRYAVFTGLFLGCALLSKWLPCLIVLPILYFFQKHQHHHSNKQCIIQFVIMITIAGLIFLPWQFYIHHKFPLEAKWEQDYNTLHFWKSLEGHDAPWYYYLNHMGIHFNELVYLPLIWFIMQLFKKRFSYNYVALLIWVIAPILFFSASATKMPGYILMCAPPLFMITAIFIVEMYQRLPELNIYKKRFSQVILFFLIALPIRYCLERLKPWESNYKSTSWVSDLKTIKFTDPDNTILFNYPAPIEAMFYTGCIAYASLPDDYTIQKCIQQGFDIYINTSQKDLNSNSNRIEQVYYIQLRTNE